MDRLAKRTLERFGAVHLVCNNAGVGAGGPLWTLSREDWSWVLGVNLWGVIHGIRAFVPHLVAQDAGHVVNTASLAGLLAPPGMGPYNATKHAVVAISETLHGDLNLAGSAVGVSVLCPGFVRTQIFEADRNRPAHAPRPESTPEEQALRDRMKSQLLAGAMEPDEVAARTVDAVREGRLWIFTHPETRPAVEARMRGILEERAPDAPGLDPGRAW